MTRLLMIIALTASACGSSDPCREAAKNIASIRFAKAPNHVRAKRIDNMVGLCKRKSFTSELIACYQHSKTMADLDACDAAIVKSGKSGLETVPE